jgi:hypothetical protein
MEQIEATNMIGTDSFQDYLKKHKEDVRDRGVEGYYHVDVVAEAYSQGFCDGKNSSRKDIISELVKQQLEKFTERANQIYILSKRIISHLKDKNYSVDSLHINLTFNRPSVIIAVPEDQLNDDDFVKYSYSKLFEIKDIYSKLFNEYLDLGLITSKDLDSSLLEEDGFGYKEVYSG